ncbi:MAG: hypothetical protein HOV70_17915 [Streptomyces sp.]|nr:hypothetical protein [Streptomyces sp.]
MPGPWGDTAERRRRREIRMRRARVRAARELPHSLGGWGLVAWFAVVLALPSYKYGDLIGGPVAVTAVWLAAVAATVWYVRREADD